MAAKLKDAVAKIKVNPSVVERAQKDATRILETWKQGWRK
jgi:hypothetical protein